MPSPRLSCPSPHAQQMLSSCVLMTPPGHENFPLLQMAEIWLPGTEYRLDPSRSPTGPPVACAAVHLPVSDTSSYSFSTDPSQPYVASFFDPPLLHSNKNLSYGTGLTLLGLQSLMRLAYSPTRLWASWKKRLGIINHFFISCSMLNKCFLNFNWICMTRSWCTSLI